MATSVTQSLFGITPQSIQNERDAALQQQALDFAKLDPFQAARMGLFQGASQLGTGIAGAMGYEDPEIAQARQRQGMLGGLDLNSPESLLTAAKSIQAQDPMAAQALVAQATDLASKQATIRKSQYDMEQDQAGYQMRFSGIKSKYPKMSDEEARSLAADPKTFGEVMKDTTQVVETAKGQVLIDKRTGKEIANIGPAVDRRNITTVDARSFNAAETAYGKSVGEDSAKRDVSLIDSAESAVKNLPKMYETRTLIETGSINTGLARSVQDVISKAKAKFLADKAAGKNVTDSEYLDALLGSEVFSQISALGIGARGMDTPAEREFMREVITGTRDMSKETLKRMLDFRIEGVERSVDTYNDRLGKGELNKYQEVTGRSLNPVSKPTRPTPANNLTTTSSGTSYRIIRKDN